MKPKYFVYVFNAEPSDMKYSVWQLIMVEEGNIKNELGVTAWSPFCAKDHLISSNAI